MKKKHKSALIISIVLIFLGILLGYIYYQKMICHDCIYISNPIGFDNLNIQGEISRKKLKSLIFEQRGSYDSNVNNCHEYNKIRPFGDNNMEMKFYAYYGMVCDFLEQLIQSKPAKKSYIKNFKLNQVEFLPGNLATTISEEPSSEMVLTYLKQGLTMKDLQEREVIYITCNSNTDITITYDDIDTHLVEVARADFNGDGIEDILLEKSPRSRSGTFGSHGALILTRFSENGMIEMAEPKKK